MTVLSELNSVKVRQRWENFGHVAHFLPACSQLNTNFTKLVTKDTDSNWNGHFSAHRQTGKTTPNHPTFTSALSCNRPFKVRSDLVAILAIEG